MDPKYTKQELYKEKCKDNAFDYMGKRCRLCGYDEPILDAYDFHHIDEATKSFALNKAFGRKGWPQIQKELDKCVMLCAVCHRKVHFFQRTDQKEYNKVVKQFIQYQPVYWTDLRNKKLTELFSANLSFEVMRSYFPGKTIADLFHHSKNLGLERERITLNKWTEEELTILSNSPTNASYRDISKYIPNHSAEAIKHKAIELGFNRGQYKPEISEDLKQKILIAKQSGKSLAEMAKEWDINYAIISKAVSILRKEMTLEERIPFELLNYREISRLL